jgi:AcrR family transcriptional regulator
VARPGTASRLSSDHATSSAATRQALVGAAVGALRDEGFAGASARSIAARAGCNQGLVFYHFGSVVGLLLAALDEVSELRLARYSAAVAGARGPSELVRVATDIFREDLDAGYVTVLAELIAGASSTPGLGAELAKRLAPWTAFAEQAIRDALVDSPLGALLSGPTIAHAIVALYLGLDMLTQLEADRVAAESLFAEAQRLAALFEGLSATVPDPKEKP